MSLFFVAFNAWRTSQMNPLWYTDPGASSTMLALTFVMLFVPLVADIIRVDDMRRQETENLLADLEISHLRLQAYTEQVAELSAAEERVRLARDIHDSLGHSLTAVHIQLEKALAYQERSPQQATQAIIDAKQAAGEALRDIRLSVGALRSTDAAFDLRLELEKLTRGMGTASFSVGLEFNGDENLYPRSARTALYRAAQEGLTNILKHAQARHALLRVIFDEKSARLVLRDDGKGFDAQKWQGAAGNGSIVGGGQALETTNGNMPPGGSGLSFGYGLRGIGERLELLQGKLTIQSDPQQGTVLTAEIPRSLPLAQTGESSLQNPAIAQK